MCSGSGSSAASISTGMVRRVGERFQCAPQPAVAEDRRMQPARDLAQLLQRGVELARGLLQQVGRGLGVRGQPRPRQAQLEHDGDEALLGAVVQVALQPAPLLVAGLDQARARRDQIGARLGAGDGQRRELAERARRSSLSGGSGFSLAIATAPHSVPVTMIGAAAVERYPVRKIASATSPVSPPQSSIRAGAPVARTRAKAECSRAGRRSPTRNSSMLSRLWRPTIVAVRRPRSAGRARR